MGSKRTPYHAAGRNTYSLSSQANSIATSRTLFRELGFSRSGPDLPPITVASAASAGRHDPIDLISANAALPRRIIDVYDRERGEENSRRFPSASQADRPLWPSEPTQPSTMFPDPSRKGFSSDQGHSQPPQSPHGSTSGSTFGSGQSPMQMPASSRTLPSPSALHYPPSASVLPPNYSPSINQSVHNAHLQDLQHQISTKTLALQTLQREHDQLLAAFSRSQIRCSTLDRKSQVSDHEINSLTEEKIRLQAQVEALESQVEDLIQSKDESQKQSAADAAQWRQIMAMASQLQAKGSEELRRYKADRESWERDRDGLQRRILELESGDLTLADASGPGESPESEAADDILTSTSLETLRAEIVRLRRSCSDMEVALRDLRRVTQQMDRVMEEFANIRERITTRTRHGLQDEQSGEDWLSDT